MKLKLTKIVMLMLGVFILLIGCSDNMLEGEAPPMPVVSVGEENIEVVRGSYCWNTGCFDYAAPPELLDGKAPFLVQNGEKIKIQFDYSPKPSSIDVSRMSETEQEWEKQALVNGLLTVPNEKGIYYYDFHANWYSEDGRYSSGDSFYAFVIRVK